MGKISQRARKDIKSNEWPLRVNKMHRPMKFLTQRPLNVAIQAQFRIKDQGETLQVA